MPCERVDRFGSSALRRGSSLQYEVRHRPQPRPGHMHPACHCKGSELPGIGSPPIQPVWGVVGKKSERVAQEFHQKPAYAAKHIAPHGTWVGGTEAKMAVR